MFCPFNLANSFFEPYKAEGGGMLAFMQAAARTVWIDSRETDKQTYVITGWERIDGRKMGSLTHDGSSKLLRKGSLFIYIPVANIC